MKRVDTGILKQMFDKAGPGRPKVATVAREYFKHIMSAQAIHERRERVFYVLDALHKDASRAKDS